MLLRSLLRRAISTSSGRDSSDVGALVRRLKDLERQLRSKSVDAAFASLHRLHELRGASLPSPSRQ